MFFGSPCDCDGGVYHVGLVTYDSLSHIQIYDYLSLTLLYSEDLDVMWNTPNDDVNEPVDSEISDPCEYVVRLHE